MAREGRIVSGRSVATIILQKKQAQVDNEFRLKSKLG
jgi:hypothetical protein